MAINAEEFLELYREYETVLRDVGLDYKEVEDKSDDLMQNRLRINRQMRNYLTHNHDAGFLDVSEKQLQFIRTLIKEQRCSMDILKKHIKTVKLAACIRSDTCDDVLSKMIKLKVEEIPVYDENGVIGFVSWTEVLKVYKKDRTAKMSSVTKLNKKFVCMGPDVVMTAVFASGVDVICCTSTGKKDGKLLGVYWA